LINRAASNFGRITNAEGGQRFKNREDALASYGLSEKHDIDAMRRAITTILGDEQEYEAKRAQQQGRKQYVNRTSVPTSGLAHKPVQIGKFAVSEVKQ